MSRDAFPQDARDHREAETPAPNPRSRFSSLEDPRNPEPYDDGRIVPAAPREFESDAATRERGDSVRAHYTRDRTYFLLDSELRTLRSVGTFRAVAADDLARFDYGGDRKRMERAVRHLKEEGLLSERSVPAGRSKQIRLFALTRKAARLVRNSRSLPEGQAIHYGFVKPREAKHDADLYRLYRAAAERIERAGGRPARVLLDFELKRNLNRDLAALASGETPSLTREEIAERHGLAVVDGKIPLPDLRVEYDTAEMERKYVDLELATRSYRPRMLAAKAKAGFSLYARREDAARLRRVLDEREITAEILSL